MLKLCREGAFAYVLAPRQVGKSSLMIRTAETLINEGFQSVVIDLNLIGTHTISPNTWYLDFLSVVETELALDVDTYKWWQEHSNVGYTRRLALFFKEILLTEIQGKIIIFIDEIDATLSLDFRDDFFASIRSLYDARAQVEEYRRLSFVLVGVATPSDLIQNPKRTPFNIGKRVDLTDFSFKEAQPLAEGLGLPTTEAGQVLTWILKWTGGHPYLTQRLCSEVQRENNQNWTESQLDRIVERCFLDEKSEQDNNLQFVRDMLTKRAVTVGVAKVLGTYRQVRQARRPVVDEEKSLIKSHLKITGIVRREAGFLKIRNPIYNKVFDD